jgi:lysozyme
MNLTPIAERLKRDEGYSATPYKDSVGVWTIGYGTNITSISQDEAEWLLRHRLSLAAQALVLACPWVEALDDIRLEVLINMAYNMGVPTLLSFRQTLAAVEQGRYGDAADGMLASLWARQVGPRAIRLAEMMRHGAAVEFA